MSYGQGSARPKRLEDEFYRIMIRVGNRDWNEFARSSKGLELERYQVDDIRTDYSHDIREQKYQMLSLWQRLHGQRATSERLNRIVEQFMAHLLQQQEGQRSHGHASYAAGDVENNQSTTIQTRNSRRSTGPSEGLISSQYVHTDNNRVIDGRSDSNSHHVMNQSLYTSGAQVDNTQQRVVALTDGANSSHAQSVKCRDVEFSQSRESSETKPKEIGGATPEKTRPNMAAPFLQKAFHPHGYIEPNANVKVTVVGRNAVGIQTNFYVGDNRKNRHKIQPEMRERLAEYCSKVIDHEMQHADLLFYESHLEKSILMYKISHRPKGVVLIINNSFAEEVDERHGSRHDERSMKMLWENIGCRPFMRHDLSSADIISTLKSFASSHHAYNSDFVSIVIMSHGGQENGEDVFYSVDRKPVRIREVLEIFNNVNARRLQGIPKLFFFQICRGDAVDKGAEIVSPVDAEEQLQSLFHSLEITVQQTSGSASEDSSDALGIATRHAPTMSDCMISFATQAGYRAFRNETNGSWYINAIVNIFSRYAHEEHVVDLMTMVNAAVATKSASSRNEALHNGKEMSSFESTLTKKLYLFPGFPIDTNEDGF